MINPVLKRHARVPVPLKVTFPLRGEMDVRVCCAVFPE